ncbi:aromatic ring-hydroxylating oxygenase subunit alpha [Aspergillus stella-maris]|uniref:aromatic ring-hydroxylating oxygenase subunit alpha n=1 Tax=Aspergillus stella-maris TaxID=1810926 RepID=UPI003CCE46B9
MKRFFGYGQSPKPSENAPLANLPASWYRSEAMYSLERRAIFSKKWFLVSHELRFPEIGSYLQLQEGGFPFFLIKDRQGKINGFHNVCRHRAYPVVQEDAGKVSILSCQYHGWSYGLNGKLAKAPRYQELAGFEKDQNGLFPIHVHIDQYGFIWVNLDAAETPTVAWEDDFAGVDEQPRLRPFDFSQYHFDHAWEMIGDYNWKTLADNYNECYHCPTGHPGIVQYTDLSKYWVETKAGHIQHYNTDHADAKGMGIISTFYFPNASMTVSPHFFYLMRCVPLSPSKTHMQYEVYRQNEASDEAFHKIDSIFKQVLKEDKDLCNAAQRNLNAGVYVNGKLHPQDEKGPLFFQQSVKELVIRHHQSEEQQGGEIWPASPVSSKTHELEEEIEFCRQLDCRSTSGSGPLSW